MLYSVLLLLSSAAIATCHSPYARVWGGHPVNIEEYRYAVMIKFDGDHIGGGSIIHSQWVLCTSHQLFGPLHRYLVLAGSANDDLLAQYYAVSKYFKHAENGADVDHDIGLILVTTPFKFAANVGPIGFGYSVGLQGKVVTMVSFGPDSTGSRGHLRAANYMVRDTESCVADVRTVRGGEENIRSGRGWCMVPVNENPVGTCNGDSGSPVVVNSVLFGVVAYGHRIHCGGNGTTVVTNVGSFIDWIYEKMGTKNKTMT